MRACVCGGIRVWACTFGGAGLLGLEYTFGMRNYKKTNLRHHSGVDVEVRLDVVFELRARGSRFVEFHAFEEFARGHARVPPVRIRTHAGVRPCMCVCMNSSVVDVCAHTYIIHQYTQEHTTSSLSLILSLSLSL